jgi:hypothetical protein
MTYQPRRTTFNPLVVGAIAVIVALVAFLVFREGTDTQQAGIQTPPVTNAPAPSAGPSGPPTATPAPKGSGNL